jgi:hypothetical protein
MTEQKQIRPERKETGFWQWLLLSDSPDAVHGAFRVMYESPSKSYAFRIGLNMFIQNSDVAEAMGIKTIEDARAGNQPPTPVAEPEFMDFLRIQGKTRDEWKSLIKEKYDHYRYGYLKEW